MSKNIEQLLQDANKIKNETQIGKNTAERIGGLFCDSLEWANENTYDGDKVEEQRTYYLNIGHDTEVECPNLNEYDSTTDTFTHLGQTWTYLNTNPSEGEDTYQIWASFLNGLPLRVSGPVRIYNSANKGSNGEDGNENEFIYKQTLDKADSATLTSWTNFLKEEKGDKLDKYGHPYTQADAVPDGWNDTAGGIDGVNYFFEYRSFRTSSIDEDGKRIWGESGFTEPVLISNWGVKGEDGDGVEYIFYADHDGIINGPMNHPERWNETTTGRLKDPEDPSKGTYVFQDNEFIASGSTWEDEPIDLSGSTFGPGSVEFISIRKKVDGVWQKFSPAKPWSRYGLDGEAMDYVVDLVNENMPVATDFEGNATNYTNRCIVQVAYKGIPLDYSDTVSENAFTYTIGEITRSDGESASNILATKDDTDKKQVNVHFDSISNFNSVNAYIPITVTLPNNTNRILECTLYGVEAGEAGMGIDLYTSTDAIRGDENNVYPPNLNFGVKLTKGENITTLPSGSGAGSAEAKGYYFGYYYDNETPATAINGSLSLASGKTYVTIEMRKGGTGFNDEDSVFVDSEQIPYLRDGASMSGLTYYYRAVESESDKPSGDNDINDRDGNDPENVGWSSSKPYLYRRPYIELTSGGGYWGNTELFNIWVDNGEPGSDGYSLIIDPGYAIFEESIDTDGEGNLVPGEVITSGWTSTVKIMKGSVEQYIDYDNLSTTACTATICTATITGEGTTALTVKVDAITQSEVTEGKIQFDAKVKLNGSSSYSKLFDVTIPIYINRIGSWAQTICGDVETTVMSKTIYDDTDTGNVITLNNLGEYIRSSSASTTTLTEEVGGLKTKESSLSLTVSTLESHVASLDDNFVSVSTTLQQTSSTLEANIRANEAQFTNVHASINGINATVSEQGNKISSLRLTANDIYARLATDETKIGELQLTASGLTSEIKEIEPNKFPSDGWTDGSGNLIEPNNVTDMCYSASTNTVINSPVIHLIKNKYTVSNYNSQNVWAFSLSASTNNYISQDAYKLVGDTYSGATRYYMGFQLNEDCDVRFKYRTNVEDALFYRPMLEIGDTLSSYEYPNVEYDSYFKQTSKEISMGVIDQFSSAGINITSNSVNINADKTNINGNLNLNANNNSDALSLFDADGIERATITSQEVGILANQSMSSVRSFMNYFDIASGGSTNEFEIGTIELKSNQVVKAGNPFEGNTSARIDFSQPNPWLLAYGIIWMPASIYYNSIYSIKLELKGSSKTYSFTIAKKPQTDNPYDNPLINFIEATSTDNVTIENGYDGEYKVLLTINFVKDSGYETINPWGTTIRFGCNVYLQVEAESKALIGSDGLYIANNDEDKTSYLHYSRDGFHSEFIRKENNSHSSIGVGSLETNDYSYLELPQDTYSGPIHFANFYLQNQNESYVYEQHWTSSQCYGNIEYTNELVTTPKASTDIIITPNNTIRVHRSNMCYDGHVISIISDYYDGGACGANIYFEASPIPVFARGVSYVFYNGLWHLLSLTPGVV